MIGAMARQTEPKMTLEQARSKLAASGGLESLRRETLRRQCLDWLLAQVRFSSERSPCHRFLAGGRRTNPPGRTPLGHLFRLLKDHIIFIGSQIPMTSSPIWSLRRCCFSRPRIRIGDINLYINSPGGSVTAGLAIYDTMQFVKPAVNTICVR